MYARRLSTILAVVVSLLVVAEIGVRAIAPALPAQLTWRDAMTETKVAQMDKLAKVGGADVVLAGTSQVLFGINPVLINKAGYRAYNAGINAGIPELNEEWLLDVVVPKLRPKLVVYTLAGPDLVDNSERWNSAVQSYRDALAVRPGPISSANRWLTRHSSLWKYHAELRDPSDLLSAVGDRVSGDGAGRDSSVAGLNPLGFSNRLAPLGFKAPKLDRQLFTQDVLVDYKVGPRQMAALERTLRALRARGIDVVLAEMPVSAALIELYPNGRADVDAVHAAITAVAARVDAPVLDMRTGLEDHGYFADYDHLNGAGALVLTNSLIAALGPAPAGAATHLRASSAQPLVQPEQLAAVPGIPPRPARPATPPATPPTPTTPTTPTPVGTPTTPSTPGVPTTTSPLPSVPRPNVPTPP